MTPIIVVTANGVDITGGVTPRLISLEITDKSGGDADELQMVLSDHDQRLALPDVGATITVAAGYGQPTSLGAYTVDEITWQGPPDRITVKGRSADLSGPIKAQREQSWDSTTLGAILGEIAIRNDLTLACDATLSAKPVDHLDQTTESDANLITRLGKDYGALITIKDGRLICVPIGSTTSASGHALPVVTIHRKQTTSASATLAARSGSYTGTAASWQDWSTGETVTETAGESGNVKKINKLYPDRETALAAAEAGKNKTASDSRSLDLTLAIGYPSITANSPLTVVGFLPAIQDATWIADEVRHTIGPQGYITSIKAKIRP